MLNKKRGGERAEWLHTLIISSYLSFDQQEHCVMRQGNVFSLGMHLFRVGDSMKPLHIWSPDPTTSSAFADFIFPHA